MIMYAFRRPRDKENIVLSVQTEANLNEFQVPAWLNDILRCER